MRKWSLKKERKKEIRKEKKEKKKERNTDPLYSETTIVHNLNLFANFQFLTDFNVSFVLPCIIKIKTNTKTKI